MRSCILLSIVAVFLMLNSCKHKPDFGSLCVAGSGGSFSIVVYARHESIPLPNYYTHLDTAFVKFGTLSSPGISPADYDTYYVGEPGEDHIHCYGLKCGDYYIFRTAWDSVENVRRYGGTGISATDSVGGLSFIMEVN